MGRPRNAEIVVRFAEAVFYTDSEKKAEDEALIRKVNSFFDLNNVGQKRILIYFTDHSNWFLKGSLGQTFILDLEDHRRDLDYRFPELSAARAIEKIDYVIILSQHIFRDGDPIFKIFTIAHEFQHIYQYAFHLRYFLMNRVLFYYFRLTISDRQSFYLKQMEIPNEYDARRKAKVINSEVNTSSVIERYLDRKISESKNGEEVDYSFLKSIEIEAEYSFEKESERQWTHYRDEISKKVIQIQGINDLDDDGKALLRAYELFKLDN
jgi:hypothetical protein